jgi:methylglutaconyl-CoA hydratase
VSEEVPVAEPKVLCDVDVDGVAAVKLNRPEVHNAMDDEVIEKLTDTLKDLAKRKDVRIVTLTGEGESFSAGGDLAWMRRAADYTRERNLEDAVALGNMFKTLNDMPQPTIALVNGQAYAGGLGLISACDIAIGVKTAKFAVTEVRLGLTAATISPHVVRTIGARNARRLFLTAERFDAEAALRYGLLHEVVEDQEELEKARDRIIGWLRQGSPQAIADSKRLIAYVTGRQIDADLVLGTAQFIADSRASDDGKEGTTAFLQKRKAAWMPKV